MRRLPASPFVYPILDAAFLAGRPVDRVAAALVAGGARLVQVRAKGVSDRALLELVRAALPPLRAVGALLIVNDRPDVARVAAADGVHVGQDDIPPAECRRLLGPHTLVGWSTHDLDQLQAAQDEPIDYVALGPIFATRSKQDAQPVVGLDLLREARGRTRLPLVAIGGITRANAARVAAAGADGLAVVSDLLQAEDPAQAVQAMTAALARSA